MEDKALYHLSVARDLLEVAEEQYEEADFASAAQFASQAREQLERAKGLHKIQAGGQSAGGGGTY
jgi:hypothetical protein